MELDRDTTLAGWHRDPSGRHELRFWDGDRWTEHVVDGGIPGLDFPTRSGRAPGAESGAESTPTPPLPAGFAEATQHDPEPAVVAELDLEAEADADAATEEEAAEAEPAAASVEPAVAVTAEAAIDEPDDSDPVESAAPAAAAASVVADTAGSTHQGSRGVRTRRRGTTPRQPVPPAPAVAASKSDTAPPVMAPAAAVETAKIEAGIEAEATPVVAPEPEPAAVVEAEAEPIVEPDPAPPIAPTPEPIRRPEPVRARVESPTATGPTVASPAGNSAGSNTSAIADPHRAPGVPVAGDSAAPPRVAGVAAVPVKRYRPGSPPPSPFAGPRALPAPAGPVGTVIEPWYSKASGWMGVLVVVAIAALAVVAILVVTSDDTSNRLGGRPPAAAPQGSKVIDGDGFGIAAPAGWIVASDPGNAFPQLRQTNWGAPLAATDSESGEGLVVVPLQNLGHNPQVDPELFWTDQVRGAGTTRTITPGPQFGVHGFRANRVTVTDPSGKALIAASIDIGDRTYLVAFTAKSETDATTRFERFIQTFDAR